MKNFWGLALTIAVLAQGVILYEIVAHDNLQDEVLLMAARTACRQSREIAVLRGFDLTGFPPCVGDYEEGMK